MLGYASWTFANLLAYVTREDHRHRARAIKTIRGMAPLLDALGGLGDALGGP